MDCKNTPACNSRNICTSGLSSHQITHLFLAIFVALNNAIANIAPHVSIFTASGPETAERAASKALILNTSRKTPNQESSRAPMFRRIRQQNTTSLKIPPLQIDIT
jgi:alkanesulfonate monooxygenase SsuD/methylene tetrahydromethanopterin reductase-like flavin-dependent oxidoreductase (luciferase family)